MEYIVLKNSDLKVSRICIGGDPMGGHAWGNTDDKELIDAVHAGIDMGINFFDTADVYGLGKAEEILGQALKGKREKAIIASKFGVRRTKDNTRTYFDNSPKWIRQAIEGSLRRLQTDYIDIYQIHDLDGVTPIESIVETLDNLKKEGKIKYYGLSNILEKDISILLPFKGRFVSFQNQYSLACRDYEDDIKNISHTLEVNPFTWGSLGQGILTGKYGRNVKFPESDRRSRATYPNFHGEKLQKNMDIVDCMREIGQNYGRQPAAVAIRYILDYLSDSIAIVGVKRREQVLSNCEACDWMLGIQDIEILEKVSRDNKVIGK